MRLTFAFVQKGIRSLQRRLNKAPSQPAQQATRGPKAIQFTASATPSKSAFVATSRKGRSVKVNRRKKMQHRSRQNNYRLERGMSALA